MAATDFLTNGTVTKLDSGNSRGSAKWLYVSTVNVPADSTIDIFSIPVIGAAGHISEFAFEAAQSTDCNVWLSEADSAIATDNETIISLSGINLGYSPELSTPRYFHNRNAASLLYLSFQNVTTAVTNDWSFTITYHRV